MRTNQTYLEPTQESGRAFFLRGISGGVVMLNLLRFRSIADYSATPNLSPLLPISGEAAYRLYMELAFLIDKKRWAEGLATEASKGIVRHAQTTLGLTRLICLVMPGNIASASVAEKVGMSFEREYTDNYGLCHIYGRSLDERNQAKAPHR